MTGKQKAVVALGAALVGTYVLGNVVKGQARVLGLNPTQVALATAGIGFVMRKA